MAGGRDKRARLRVWVRPTSSQGAVVARPTRRDTSLREPGRDRKIAAMQGSLTQERVGVLAVDDQPVFLAVAREVVDATEGFQWVGDATSGEAAIDAVEELEPALVLLDVQMPGIDGIETARRICATHPEVVVVLISVDQGVVSRPAAEASGAVALVRKQDLGPAMLRDLWLTHHGPSP